MLYITIRDMFVESVISSREHITTTPNKIQPSQSSAKHPIQATTSVLQGETDWTSILQQDLALSDDETEPLSFETIVSF